MGPSIIDHPRQRGGWRFIFLFRCLATLILVTEGRRLKRAMLSLRGKQTSRRESDFTVKVAKITKVQFGLLSPKILRKIAVPIQA